MLYVRYENDGGQWFVIEAPSIFGSFLVEVADPRSVLTSVQKLLETDEVGPATIDGVATTQYRSQVDLGSESLGQAEWLAIEGLDIDAEGDVIIDLYVDGDQVLRRLFVTSDVRENRAGSGAATFGMMTSFFDLGADLSVEAPADASPLDQMQG